MASWLRLNANRTSPSRSSWALTRHCVARTRSSVGSTERVRCSKAGGPLVRMRLPAQAPGEKCEVMPVSILRSSMFVFLIHAPPRLEVPDRVNRVSGLCPASWFRLPGALSFGFRLVGCQSHEKLTGLFDRRNNESGVSEVPGGLNAMRVIKVLLSIILLSSNVLCASTIRQDLQHLVRLTSWELTESRDEPQVCAFKMFDLYGTVEIDHTASSNLNDQDATAEIIALNRKIDNSLKQRGWSKMDIPLEHREELPRWVGHYSKKGVTIRIYLETARCTMNSPCTAFDGLQLILNTPGRRKS